MIDFLLLLLPWKLRRLILIKLRGYKIHKTAKIGFSIIKAKSLTLGANAYIGHLTICKGIDRLELGEGTSIGNKNFITGFSKKNPLVLRHGHFSHLENRQCSLIIGKETGITSRHYFDCNGGIFIGDFCQIAGLGTHFLTHSIDLEKNRQDAAPIHIENYCFIGTRSTLLKGVSIPAKSVIGACSLVNKTFEEEGCLYAGVPAKKIKGISHYEFFNRTTGFVR